MEASLSVKTNNENQNVKNIPLESAAGQKKNPTEFKYLSTQDKIKTVVITIFVGILTLGIGSYACFKHCVKHYHDIAEKKLAEKQKKDNENDASKLNADDPLKTTSKADDVAQKLISNKLEEEVGTGESVETIVTNEQEETIVSNEQEETIVTNESVETIVMNKEQTTNLSSTSEPVQQPSSAIDGAPYITDDEDEQASSQGVNQTQTNDQKPEILTKLTELQNASTNQSISNENEGDDVQNELDIGDMFKDGQDFNALLDSPVQQPLIENEKEQADNVSGHSHSDLVDEVAEETTEQNIIKDINKVTVSDSPTGKKMTVKKRVKEFQEHERVQQKDEEIRLEKIKAEREETERKEMELLRKEEEERNKKLIQQDRQEEESVILKKQKELDILKKLEEENFPKLSPKAPSKNEKRRINENNLSPASDK